MAVLDRPLVPPGHLRHSRAAGAFTMAVMLTGCSTLSENRKTDPVSPTVRVPPPAVAAVDGPTSPPIVWVPEWGVYLREGQDVVIHRGIYYRYDAGAWHASDSPQGPWTQLSRVPEPRPADRAPRAPQEPSPRNRARMPPERREAPPGGPAARPGPAIAIDRALKHVGAPYRWGGATPAGFDCSGFVRYVYARSGLPLPRTVAEQYQAGRPVRRDSLRPGDLVFFDRLRHNGIYIGRGQFVHASSGAGRVSVSRLDDDWFRQRWIGGRRIEPAATAARGAVDAVPVGAPRDGAGGAD
jgi:cell wall-associated NlpC family hydrolase